LGGAEGGASRDTSDACSGIDLKRSQGRGWDVIVRNDPESSLKRPPGEIPMKTRTLIFALLSLAILRANPAGSAPPIRLAVVGLVHDHARLLFPLLPGRSDYQLVGIVEPDREVADYYKERFNLDPALFFPSFGALLAKTSVQAVATFTSTADHRRVVEMCAPLGIDVMMEKPMATNLDDARAIAAAAAKGGIQVVVNFETTWYPSNRLAYDMVVGRHAIGDIRKILVQDGNQGPMGIQSTPYFFKWLTDPDQGGGPLRDFGCYGADLVTWLMGERRPDSVLAMTQNFQAATYPRVEDESTIILAYPDAQAVIQASWNWPYGRKDMEIYGLNGAVLVPTRDLVRLRSGDTLESTVAAPALSGPETDQLSYLAAVVRGELRPSGLSSVRLNMVVTEILDAARESARTGRRVDLPGAPPW
jgi:predicted dehydrogenase